MRQIIMKKWNQLRADWQQLYNENTTLSPFQSYEFLSFSGKGKLSHREPFRLVGLKELNLVLYEDGQPLAAAALLYKKTNGRLICYLRGHFTTANYLDLVYTPRFSYADFQALMDEVRKHLGDAAFQFDRIRDDSVTSRYMQAYFPSLQIHREGCACISLEQGYDGWWQSLPKSTKQSLNNRRNRLLTDGANWSAEFYRGCDMDKRTEKEAMRVCAARYITKNAYRFGPFTRPMKHVLAALMRRDQLSRWVARSQNSFVALLRINVDIAAFASMAVCRDRQASGIRFAISARFARYTPGGLLLGELIRYLTDPRQKDKPDIQQLDMGQGVSGGRSYKFAYGGEPRCLYFFFAT